MVNYKQFKHPNSLVFNSEINCIAVYCRKSWFCHMHARPAKKVILSNDQQDFMYTTLFELLQSSLGILKTNHLEWSVSALLMPNPVQRTRTEDLYANQEKYADFLHNVPIIQTILESRNVILKTDIWWQECTRQQRLRTRAANRQTVISQEADEHNTVFSFQRTSGRTETIVAGVRQTTKSWHDNTPGCPSRWVPARTRCGVEVHRRGRGQGRTVVAPSGECRQVVCGSLSHRHLSGAGRRSQQQARNCSSVVQSCLNWRWWQVSD